MHQEINNLTDDDIFTSDIIGISKSKNVLAKNMTPAREVNTTKIIFNHVKGKGRHGSKNRAK